MQRWVEEWHLDFERVVVGEPEVIEEECLKWNRVEIGPGRWQAGRSKSWFNKAATQQ